MNIQEKNRIQHIGNDEVILKPENSIMYFLLLFTVITRPYFAFGMYM